MRRLLYTMCAVVLLMGFCVAAQAVFVPPAGGEVKYSQPPMTCGGYDFASMVDWETTGFIMMDDWVCPDGLPVTDIHWWGSYWSTPAGGQVIYSDWIGGADPIPDITFEIAIFSDIPADDLNNPYGFSIPNLEDVLFDQTFGSSEFTESYAFTDIKIPGAVQETVYKYDLFLDPSDWFYQEEGTIYWLSIVASGGDGSTQWGWHNSCSQRGDFAVQASYDGDLGDFYIPCGGVDMAFELTTVPEPGSLLALGAGLSSLLGLAVRKRRAK